MLDTGLIDLVSRVTRVEERGGQHQKLLEALLQSAEQQRADAEQAQRREDALRARLDALEAKVAD